MFCVLCVPSHPALLLHKERDAPLFGVSVVQSVCMAGVVLLCPLPTLNLEGLKGVYFVNSEAPWHPGGARVGSSEEAMHSSISGLQDEGTSGGTISCLVEALPSTAASW